MHGLLAFVSSRSSGREDLAAPGAGRTRLYTSSSMHMAGARPQAPKQRATSRVNMAVRRWSRPRRCPALFRSASSTCLPPAHVAGRAQADPDQVLAAGLGGEEGVEPHDSGHLAVGLVQAEGDPLQDALRAGSRRSPARSAAPGSGPPACPWYSASTSSSRARSSLLGCLLPARAGSSLTSSPCSLLSLVCAFSSQLLIPTWRAARPSWIRFLIRTATAAGCRRPSGRPRLRRPRSATPARPHAG